MTIGGELRVTVEKVAPPIYAATVENLKTGKSRFDVKLYDQRIREGNWVFSVAPKRKAHDKFEITFRSTASRKPVTIKAG